MNNFYIAVLSNVFALLFCHWYYLLQFSRHAPDASASTSTYTFLYIHLAAVFKRNSFVYKWQIHNISIQKLSPSPIQLKNAFFQWLKRCGLFVSHINFVISDCCDSLLYRNNNKSTNADGLLSDECWHKMDTLEYRY